MKTDNKQTIKEVKEISKQSLNNLHTANAAFINNLKAEFKIRKQPSA